MVIITREKKAREIFLRYRSVAAFTFGNKKGLNEDGLEIRYAKINGILPTDDEINAITTGDVKKKKLIQRMLKSLHSPANPDNKDLCLAVSQLMNIVEPEHRETKVQTVMVFVLDDAEDAKEKNKIYSDFISAIFAEFGIEVIRDGKLVKKALKIFKGKVPCDSKSNKSAKKKYHKYEKAVVEFLKEHPECRINKDGHRLKKVLITYFSMELTQSSIGILGIDRLTETNRNNMVAELVRVFSNDNLRILCTLGIKDKEEKKLCKALVKKNKFAVKAYNDLRDIIAEAGYTTKLPKGKNGYGKKRRGKKKGKDEPRMNMKRLKKVLSKKRSLGYLVMIYTHLTLMTLGVTVGSREYNRHMTPVTKYVGDEFSTKFIQAAKAWSKENPEEASDK